MFYSKISGLFGNVFLSLCSNLRTQDNVVGISDSQFPDDSNEVPTIVK